MVVISESLLEAIAPDAPCGSNLEYDAEFTALERAATPPSEARLVGTAAAEDGPDWSAVARHALALMARTKDLRVTSVLIKALLHTDGVVGLGQGVAALRALIERYWDSIHPQLVADDDNDPTMRINALRELCDRRSMLAALRVQPLVSLAGLGKFSLKDIAVAMGEAQPAAGEAAPDMAKIEAAFSNCDVTQLSASSSAIGQAIADLRAIEAAVSERLGVESALSLEELTSLLTQMHKIVRTRLEARTPAELQASGAANGAEGLNGSGGTGHGVALGEVSSRADVQRVLDKLCAYYEKHEPSSPVPLLLRRARRLASMNFMEIVRELAPGGTAEIETIRGPENTDNGQDN
jgi:type VI secretion system protein ImpA